MPHLKPRPFPSVLYSSGSASHIKAQLISTPAVLPLVSDSNASTSSVFNGLESFVRLGTSASLMLQGTTSNSTNAPNHLKRSLRAASSKRDLCISEGCKSSQSSTCCKHESVAESRPQIFANYQSALRRRAPGEL